MTKLLAKLQKVINSSQLQRIKGLANRITEEHQRIDQWLAGVELTADRVGFLMTNHLEPCIDEIRSCSGCQSHWGR